MPFDLAPPASRQHLEPPSRRPPSPGSSSSRTRAAASSIAKGIPSRRRHTSPTHFRSLALILNPAPKARPAPRRAAPRPTGDVRRRRLASAGGATQRSTCSPSIPSAAGSSPYRHPRTRPRRKAPPAGGLVEHVLAVVEHQQHPAVAKKAANVCRGRARDAPSSKTPAPASTTPLRTAHRSQLEQPGTQGDKSAAPRRNLQREPGLAHPADTRQRHQPRLVQRRYTCPLPLAADQLRHLQRQVPGHHVQ